MSQAANNEQGKPAWAESPAVKENFEVGLGWNLQQPAQCFDARFISRLRQRATKPHGTPLQGTKHS